MAVDAKKGLGSVKLPSLPWSRLAKLTRLQKVLICVLVLLLLFAGFVWLFYLPQKNQLETLRNDLSRAQSQLAKLRQVEKNLRKFKKEYKETEAKFKKALQLLPNKDEIPGLLTSISSLGAQAGLEFLLFKPQKEVAKNFYAEIPLKLQVSGPYHNVATFLDRMSRLNRIVNVSDMKMTLLKRQGDEVILKTDCTAVTYKFVEKPPEKKKKGSKRKKKRR
ncbi:MAG: type 4a pilus biogenesis protein PilO [Deltaproteobacteria bacterium]|nr:type 4a pilus biogenesis protein PilO [Deltaproteobacteria bacterium]MBW2070533.1 type 4a pilus biogenesis protein PilO [Deltaproteobacteria bacterium]